MVATSPASSPPTVPSLEEHHQMVTDSSDVLVESSNHSVAFYLSCRSKASDRVQHLQLVSTRAPVILQILKAKANFFWLC